MRLAHVAFTRAKDRLYVTSHRIAEGSADASSLEAARASNTSQVKMVYPSETIPLVENITVVSRTCHPIDIVEQYLTQCAEDNHSIKLWPGGTTFVLDTFVIRWPCGASDIAEV